MAKRTQLKTNSETELGEPTKKRWLISINETWTAILTGFGLISIGFGIGLWVSSIEQKDELRQKEIDCEKRIEEERKAWEKEKKNEALIEGLSTVIYNINKNKNEDK